MRYAVIQNDVVINVAVWDGVTDWPLPSDITVVKSDTLNIGDTYE